MYREHRAPFTESMEHHRPCLRLEVTDLLLCNAILEVHVDPAIGESLMLSLTVFNEAFVCEPTIVSSVVGLLA